MQQPANSSQPFPEETVRRALQSVRRLVEARGWDAPFSVFGLRRAEQNTQGASPENAAAVEITLLGEGSHPFEDLPGLRLPPRFDAAILATEGWQYPRRLESAGMLALELEGLPSTLPDRLENRLLTYVSRSGESFALLLTYRTRDTPPEEVEDFGGLGGRAQDAFRRFVGLPVDECETVVHILGRFWLGGLLTTLAQEPALRVEHPLAAAHDPLETFMGPLRESVLEALSRDEQIDRGDPAAVASFTEGAGGEALRKFALDTIAGFEWEDLRRAALLGIIDFAIPVDVVEWCDAGMFSRIVSEHVSTQRELLDAILRYSPILATEALEELGRRGWLEPFDVLPRRPPQ